MARAILKHSNQNDDDDAPAYCLLHYRRGAELNRIAVMLTYSHPRSRACVQSARVQGGCVRPGIPEREQLPRSAWLLSGSASRIYSLGGAKAQPGGGGNTASVHRQAIAGDEGRWVANCYQEFRLRTAANGRGLIFDTVAPFPMRVVERFSPPPGMGLERASCRLHPSSSETASSELREPTCVSG